MPQMEPPRPTRGDSNAPDGLLIIVDCTGIPVLVRPYGDAQIPPSAVVGIISAVFHAAKVGDASELHALRSANRKIVYVLGKGEILMAYTEAGREDGTKRAAINTDFMLRVLFRALELVTGTAFGDLESAKLRVAISRNLAIIDYVVAHSTSDARLSLGLPVFEAGYGRERVMPSVQPSSLMYAAWIQDGIVQSEMGSSADMNCNGVDLAIFSIAAELHMKNKNPVVTLYAGEPVKIVGTRADSWQSNQFVLGVFSSEAAAPDIETFMTLVKTKTSASMFSHSSAVHESLHQWFARGLQCCFVVPSVSGANHRVIALRNPRQDSSQDAALNRPPWTMLSQFARDCTLSSASKVQRMDYKQEDEAFTFIHCARSPFSIYAICRGPMPMATVVELGNAVASAFLFMAA